jgi:glycosyltransferase involved in cell wall biosynthesis
VQVLTTNVDGRDHLEVPLGVPVDVDGVEVRYFPVRAPRRLYVSPRLRDAAAERLRDCEVAHLHSVFLWPTSAAARLAHRREVPVVLSPRGMLVPELMRRRGRLRKHLWLNLVERRTLRRAAAIHCTSALEARDLARARLALSRVVVVPNGVDVVTPPAPQAVGARVAEVLRHRPLLLFLGRLSWKKGLEPLVEALAEIGDAQLALAGPDEDGLSEPLQALATRHGCGDRLTILGPVAGADKAALLCGCDALVLPSVHENFGNAALEAMSAGRPVIVTPGVGLADTVAAHGAGIVAGGTAVELARAAREILGAPERARTLGENGARAVAEQFTWERVAARMEDLYTELGARRAPPA